MSTARMSRCGIALCLSTLLAIPASALPDAEAIMKRADAVTKSFRTYQVTMESVVDGGQMGKMTTQMVVKTLGGKKTSMKQTIIGTPTGLLAMGSSMGGSQMVDDGTNLWMYMPALKQYRKSPSQATRSGALGGAGNILLGGAMNGMTFKFLKTDTLAGRPVYVIQGIPKQGAPGPRAAMKMTFFIDQGTSRLKKATMSMPLPMGAPGQAQGKPQTMNVTMLVKKEILNEPIPESEFKFTPPPGTTEMKIPGGRGMGMPGSGPPR